MNHGEACKGRLRSMKLACERKGHPPASVTFNGLSIADFSREELEIMLAFAALKTHDHIGEDVHFPHETVAAH